MFYLLPFSLSFILAVIITPLVKIFAQRQKIFDYPYFNQRKIHSRPIPQLGGVAIFLAFSITTILFWYTRIVIDSKICDNYILFIIIASLVLVLGGFLDDKYNLKPGKQIIFPVIATILILIVGIKISYITNPLGGVINFIPLVSIPLTFLWLTGMMYTTKFLDGLDGLTTGITAIGAIIIFIVSLFWDVPNSGTSVLALILAGSALGFLIYNWHPAKIFLGEGGSVLTGFLLGVLAIISGSKVATTLLVMGIPILDVLWVILRRSFWEKKLPFKADRKHLHFRLLDIGFSHRQAVLFLYFLAILFGATSLFLHTKGKILALVILSLIMIIIAVSIVVIYKKKKIKSSQV